MRLHRQADRSLRVPAAPDVALQPCAASRTGPSPDSRESPHPPQRALRPRSRPASRARRRGSPQGGPPEARVPPPDPPRETARTAPTARAADGQARSRPRARRPARSDRPARAKAGDRPRADRPRRGHPFRPMQDKTAPGGEGRKPEGRAVRSFGQKPAGQRPQRLGQERQVERREVGLHVHHRRERGAPDALILTRHRQKPQVSLGGTLTLGQRMIQRAGLAPDHPARPLLVQNLRQGPGHVNRSGPAVFPPAASPQMPVPDHRPPAAGKGRTRPSAPRTRAPAGFAPRPATRPSHPRPGQAAPRTGRGERRSARVRGRARGHRLPAGRLREGPGPGRPIRSGQ